MKKGLGITLGVVIGMALIVFVIVNIYCRNEARNFVHNTLQEQELRINKEYEAGWIQGSKNPIRVIKFEETGLPLEQVSVINDSGMTLNGWYMPSQNGAAVMLMHGATAFPYHMLEEAKSLERHGYGALLISVRNHNFGDGDTLSFGCDDREMEDFDAWFEFLKQQEGIDPDRIGLMGQSMGGTLAIQYAAQNEGIRAVVAHSAPSSVKDAVETFTAWMTGLPPWVANLIAGNMLFWVDTEIDCEMSVVSAKEWIDDISPRAVYILHGGDDKQLPAASGEWLFATAGEPKYYWLCPDSGHHECDTDYPAEFEERIIGFFDDHLRQG
ncbi:MAG TPA: alpha/beta fold hydrolase [Anaerolineae bacterium]|jgi:esterase/lipase|nr:alpha/beta fold hydrolase [Anaerolineae bacterium]